jgi:hypothetical protein
MDAPQQGRLSFINIPHAVMLLDTSPVGGGVVGSAAKRVSNNEGACDGADLPLLPAIRDINPLLYLSTTLKFCSTRLGVYDQLRDLPRIPRKPITTKQRLHDLSSDRRTDHLCNCSWC